MHARHPPLKARFFNRLAATACLSACTWLGACTATPVAIPDDEPLPDTSTGSDAAKADADAGTSSSSGGLDIVIVFDTEVAEAPDVPPVDVPKDTKPPVDTKTADTVDTKDSGATDAGDAGSVDTDGGTGDIGGDVGTVCIANQELCDKGKAVKCAADGSALQVVDDCEANGQVCSAGKCAQGVQCDKAQTDFCDADTNSYFQCLDDGKTKKLLQKCGVGEVCAVDNDFWSCYDKKCTADTLGCDGDDLTLCNKYGNEYLSFKHPAAKAKGSADCAADQKSCVVKDGKPSCATATCGDGKKNGDEQCDDGKANGTKSSLCTVKCESVDQGCETAKQCSDKLPLLPCMSHWVCLVGHCSPIPSVFGGCDDGDPCTELDTCDFKQDGSHSCVGKPLDCDDGNPCTTDSCDEAGGGCASEGATGKPCDDNNACTVGDQCQGKSCASGTNACTCKIDADCAAYDDGDACTGVVLCKSGKCVNDQDTITTCGDGVCINADVTNKAICEGKDIKGKMYGGKCHLPQISSKSGCESAKGVWVTNEACRVATCQKHLGFCVATPKPGHVKCEDGNACTKGDVCSGGTCSGSKVFCNDGENCTDDECDAQKGCVYKENNSPCSDGDQCTAGDKCSGKTCVGEKICECKSDADCAGKDPTNKCLGTHFCKASHCYINPKTVTTCPDNGTQCAPIGCDPGDGKCKVVDPPGEGTPCTVDDDICVVEAVCKCADGNCANRVCAGKQAVCNDNNACTTDSCDKKVGCVFTKTTQPCDDGDPCTNGDRCGEGLCQPGKQECTSCGNDSDCAKIDDANPNKCQGDYFCTKGICIYKASYVECGAGTCSIPEHTTFGACESAGGKWTDYAQCAVGSCDKKTGNCFKEALTGVCDDNDNCTVNDYCTDGDCKTDKRTCNDQDPCTVDSCDPDNAQGGCVFDAKKADGLACDDGNKCTVGSKCLAITVEKGFCAAGSPKSCDDGNACTSDSCEGATGACSNSPRINWPCSTGDKCYKDGQCDFKTATCVTGDKIQCLNSTFCLPQECTAKDGCVGVSLPDEATCPSASFKCHDKARCLGGNCKADLSAPTKCDDDNVCTDDKCDEAVTVPNQKSCVFSANSKDCDDDNACSEDDKCTSKVCFGTTVDCNDENACTLDACDKKTGCSHKAIQGVCGAFAGCSNAAVPTCEFANSGEHVVISELSIGAPGPEDDFIELYNASTLVTDLGDYVVQFRSPDVGGVGGWDTLAVLPKGVPLLAGRYFVVGNVAKLLLAQTADLATAQLVLAPRGGQVRIFDKAHTLEHDRVVWGIDKCGKPAQGAEGKPLPRWPGWGSWQRKANKLSTAASLSPSGAQWLAGNALDTDDNANDFVASCSVEPQIAKLGKTYEPACFQSSGVYACGGQTPVCDYKGSPLAKDEGKDQCIADKACAQGCGAAQRCEAAIGQCIPDGSLVFSEVFVGSTGGAGQFVELHNKSKVAIDISNMVVQAKLPTSAPGGTWDQSLAIIPAGTVLPAGRFYLIATKKWVTNTAGGVDYVVAQDMVFGPGGGAVQVHDCRTGVVLDLFGWGANTKTASSKPFNITSVPNGQSLVRKASSNSHPGTMSDGGSDQLTGNALDNDNDRDDWTLRLTPEPMSLRSGQFKPACSGTCSTGQVCNFAATGSKCVDPTCGGCKPGAGCDAQTGKCEATVMISGFANYGDTVKVGNVTIPPTSNWFIELYNPGDSTIDLTGMLIQYRAKGQSWQSLTQGFPDGICVKAKSGGNTACDGGPDPCECKGRGDSNCKSDSDCPTMLMEPGRYALVVPTQYDPALPKPDLISPFTLAMSPDTGELRIVHQDAPKIFGPSLNKLEADQVAWGNPSSSYEPDMLPQLGKEQTCDGKEQVVIGQTCMLRRLPQQWTADAEMLTDADHPAAYAGSGLRTSWFKDDDWVRVCPRAPRNSAHVPLKP